MSITRLNHFTAKPGSADALATFLIGVIDVVSTAEGCLFCQLLHDSKDPLQLVILEKWTSIAAHQKAATMIPQEQIMSVMEFLAEPPKGEYLVPAH
jgi:quinol monooxygenase YgiN